VQHRLGFELLGRLFEAASALGRSSSSTVNEISAEPSAPAFCTIMSTATLTAASLEKIA
jgi:hypothetical protein